MSDFLILEIAMIVVQAGKSINHESATRIEIVDEGGGPFLEISQDDGKIRIEAAEWLKLKQAIERMFDIAGFIEREHKDE